MAMLRHGSWHLADRGAPAVMMIAMMPPAATPMNVPP